MDDAFSTELKPMAWARRIPVSALVPNTSIETLRVSRTHNNEVELSGNGIPLLQTDADTFAVLCYRYLDSLDHPVPIMHDIDEISTLILTRQPDQSDQSDQPEISTTPTGDINDRT